MEAHLKVAYEDTLDVYLGEEKIGSVAPTAVEGWAAYLCNFQGRLLTPRIATVGNIEDAVRVVVITHKEKE